MTIEERDPWRHATQNKARLARGVNNDMKKVGIVPVVAMMTVAPQVFDAAVGVSVVSGMLARTYENDLIEEARTRAECPPGMTRVVVPIKFWPIWVQQALLYLTFLVVVIGAGERGWTGLGVGLAGFGVYIVVFLIPCLVARWLYLQFFGVTKYSYEPVGSDLVVQEASLS